MCVCLVCAVPVCWCPCDRSRSAAAARSQVSDGAFLLRPELAESTYLVFQATRDRSWLAAGKHVLESLRVLRHECGVPCVKGAPSIVAPLHRAPASHQAARLHTAVRPHPPPPDADVTTRTLLDWTPSFYLSELLKYLYLCVNKPRCLSVTRA